MMLKRVIFFYAITAGLVFSFPCFAIDFDPDSYGSLSDYLEEVYGVDGNAGLTAFPVLNVPMGGRAEGMAGAFSAVADDVSFIEWNPAGSARLARTELAFFHNNWIADTKVEGAAFGMRHNDFGIAAATKWVYTPFTEYNIWGDRVSKGYYAEGVAILNMAFNLFPGYYFRGLAVGVNIKPAFRFVPDYADSDSDEVTIDTDKIIAGSGASQSAVALMGDVGLLYRGNFLKFYNSRDENFSLAFVMKNFGVPDVTFKLTEDPLPSVIVGGVAYRPIRPVLISFDYSVPINLYDITLSEKPFYAAGFSVTISRFLSMRGGLRLKAGGTRITIGSAIALEKIVFDINYTLDLATQIQPLNRVSVGVRLDLGDHGRSRIDKQVDEFYLAGLDSYAQGNDADAKRLWQEALKLNTHFEPAREGLSAIRAEEELQQRISRIQATMER
ncbi:MAG: UPF0164 family protein [Spirochaetaceae bacterium]|nr:UPF0164 family protein [Spirochaetaceae bacterium]